MVSRRLFVSAGIASLFVAPRPGFAQLAPQMEGSYQIPERYWLREVTVKRSLPAGEIHILQGAKFLYWTLGEGRALRYGVAVGQDGLRFSGAAEIGRKVKWPSWRPTASMIARNPSYAEFANGMPGGPNNPLGARALYLYRDGRDTAIRIHGTTNPASIGTPSSNGCFRMYNSHVIDLFDRVPIGTKVVAY